MKRKVQQLGTSTLAVTLPADWARQHAVEKGDEIIVQRDETGGSLLLVPETSAIGDSEATIDADLLAGEALERAVVTQYVLGRQLITVERTVPLDREHHDAVLAAERRLMGLGVVEQTDDRITVRCSVAPADFDLPTLLGRLGRTEATMRRDAVAALLEADTDRAERVITRERQVQKLFFLFLRLVFATYRDPRFNRAVGLETGFPLIGYRSVAQDVILMADIAVGIARIARESDGPSPPPATADRVRALAEALDEAVDATREAITTADYDAVEAAREAFVPVDAEVDGLNDHLAAERPEPLLALQRAAVLLERSARHARDSLSVATHLAFRDDPDLVSGG